MNPNAVVRADTTSGQTKMVTSSATATRMDITSDMLGILKQYARNGRKTMKDECIRKQDTVKKCGEWYVEEGTEEGFIGTVDQMLDMFSPADVAPVVHAYWIRHENADIICGYYVPSFECSQCGTWKEDDSDFCPDCGAKMDGERREDTVNTAIPAIVDVADVEITEGFSYMTEPADGAPVKHTYWIPQRCSACGYPVSRRTSNNNFCPNCGAKMDGKEQNA